MPGLHVPKKHATISATRTVEEILLQRRVTKLQGSVALSNSISSLPVESCSRLASKDASASDLSRKKHRLRKNGAYYEPTRRLASPATTLEPLQGVPATTGGASGGFRNSENNGCATTTDFPSGGHEGDDTTHDDLRKIFVFRNAGALGSYQKSASSSAGQLAPKPPVSFLASETSRKAAATAQALETEAVAQGEEAVAALACKCNSLATRLARVEKELEEEREVATRLLSLAGGAQTMHTSPHAGLDGGSGKHLHGGGDVSGGDGGVPPNDESSMQGMSLLNGLLSGGRRSGLLSSDNLVKVGVVATSSTSSSTSSGRLLPSSLSTAAAHSAQAASVARLDGHLEGLRDKLSQLKDVWYASVDEERKREHSVSVIQCQMKRQLVKRRFQRMQASALAWRRAHSQELVGCCLRELERHRLVAEKVGKLTMIREQATKHKLFKGWELEMRATAALRRHLKETAKVMEDLVKQKWEKAVVRAWRGVCTGPSSKAACRERYAERVAAAREVIEARMREAAATNGGGVGVRVDRGCAELSDKAVMEEMNKGLYEELVMLRVKHCKAHVFHSGFKAMMAMLRAELRGAATHHALVLCRRVFTPWAHWAAVHAKGLDRKQWEGPRRYAVPVNLGRVNQWARTRILRKVVPAWRRFTKVSLEVTALARRSWSRFARKHLKAWRVKACHLRKLRSVTVEKWRAKQRRLLSIPFKAWVALVGHVLLERSDGARVVEHYKHLKKRQTMYHIIRTWRHQTVFGHLEGLYSRTELMRSLAEQKQHVLSLTHLDRQFTEAVEESRRMLTEEHGQVKALETQLEGREHEVETLQMALHHSEQDAVKTRVIVESLAQDLPDFTNHLETMQRSFGFRVRGLDELAMLRAEQEEMEEILSKIDDATDWMEAYSKDLKTARAKLKALGDAALDPKERAFIRLGKMHEATLKAQSTNKSADPEAVAQAIKEAEENVALQEEEDKANEPDALEGDELNPFLQRLHERKLKQEAKGVADRAAAEKERHRRLAVSAMTVELGFPPPSNAATTPRGTPIPSSSLTLTVNADGTTSENPLSPLSGGPMSPGGSESEGESSAASDRRQSSRMSTNRQSMVGAGSVRKSTRMSKRGSRRMSEMLKRGGTLAHSTVMAAPPMVEGERAALMRLHFALGHANFREVSESGGEELYKEDLFGVFSEVTTEQNASSASSADSKGTEVPPALSFKEGAAAEGGGVGLYPASPSATNNGSSTYLTASGEGANSAPQKAGGPPSREEIMSRHAQYAVSMKVDALTLHGALEFIRSGNPEALPVHLRHEWMHGENMKLVGTYKGRKWDELIAHGRVVRPPSVSSSSSSSSTPAAGAPAASGDDTRAQQQHQQPPLSPLPKLPSPLRRDELEDGVTWRDLVVAVNARLPLARRTATVNERMDSRISAMHQRMELTATGLYGSLSKAPHGDDDGDDGDDKEGANAASKATPAKEGAEDDEKAAEGTAAAAAAAANDDDDDKDGTKTAAEVATDADTTEPAAKSLSGLGVNPYSSRRVVDDFCPAPPSPWKHAVASEHAQMASTAVKQERDRVAEFVSAAVNTATPNPNANANAAAVAAVDAAVPGGGASAGAAGAGAGGDNAPNTIEALVLLHGQGGMGLPPRSGAVATPGQAMALRRKAAAVDSLTAKAQAVQQQKDFQLSLLQQQKQQVSKQKLEQVGAPSFASVVNTKTLLKASLKSTHEEAGDPSAAAMKFVPISTGDGSDELGIDGSGDSDDSQELPGGASPEKATTAFVRRSLSPDGGKRRGSFDGGIALGKTSPSFAPSHWRKLKQSVSTSTTFKHGISGGAGAFAAVKAAAAAESSPERATRRGSLDGKAASSAAPSH